MKMGCQMSFKALILIKLCMRLMLSFTHDHPINIYVCLVNWITPAVIFLLNWTFLTLPFNSWEVDHPLPLTCSTRLTQHCNSAEIYAQTCIHATPNNWILVFLFCFFLQNEWLIDTTVFFRGFVFPFERHKRMTFTATAQLSCINLHATWLMRGQFQSI